MIMFLAFLWCITPLTVALLTGSIFWTVASSVIGGVVVFAAMGITSLLDDYGPPPPLTPEQREIDDALDDLEQLTRQLYRAECDGDHGEVIHLRAELNERSDRLQAMFDHALREAKP